MDANKLSTPFVSGNEKQKKQFDLKVSSFDLFEDRLTYINGSRIYYAYFEIIPSTKFINNIDHKKTIKWVETELANDIEKKHLRENLEKNKRRIQIASIIFILKNKIVIKIENENTCWVYYSEESETEAQKIFNGLKKFVRKSTESFISIIVQGEAGLELQTIKNKKIKLQLNENYNDELIPVHDLVLKELKTKNNSGLVLFHGKPGTGKSTYLRFLIYLLKQKRVIFLSPKLAGNLDSPALMKLLLENRNSVLIIEDAEDLITERGKGNDSNISTLLNLTDGILGESLGIQVICTFNTALSNIDKALLRKGRLVALYEFNALTKNKAQQLSDALGYKNRIDSDMILAEIFHQEKTDFNIRRKESIGFTKN